jgi:hypothetical protein
MTTPLPTFDELLRQKLVALVTAADLTLETASVQIMGKSESWLRRRLGAPAGAKATGHQLTSQDVTLILAALRIPTDRLLDPAPILIDGDLNSLRLLDARKHAVLTLRRQVGKTRLQRLQVQELVGKDLRLTPAGRAILVAASDPSPT